MHTLQQLRTGELAGTVRLKLSCGLTEFPAEIFELADTLEILDLSGNQLSQLPADFARLHRLKIFFCSDNVFTVFPEVLAQCPLLEMVGFKSNKIETIAETALPAQLRWLILTNNQLKVLPETIGNCHRLQKCMLAGNRLKTLPDSLAQCHNLGLLRISANELEVLPEWLFTMPRLSWLAFAGNPCCIKPQLAEQPAFISWSQLEVTHQLGEGASGFVSTGRWKAPDVTPVKEVAVKVFKGEVTSDGLPGEEMNACMAAGTHPHLVRVLGQIADHPEAKKGLVLHLIPADYKNLGGPPDFTTCTRDTFAAGTEFTLEHVLSVAKAMAAVGAHLHERGIMHGDLYAHNILTDEAGGVLLVDYGAASMYDRTSVHAGAIERLEVSAYGWLLDDLLTHLVTEPAYGEVVQALRLVQQNCVLEQVLQRPPFHAIVVMLSVIGGSMITGVE